MSEEDQCYICWGEETEESPFAKEPCNCKGSIHIHATCLEKLNSKKCSTCKKDFRYYSSDGIPVTHKHEETYIQEIKVDRHGKYHGKVRTYFKNNIVRSETEYIHGEKEGLHIENHPMDIDDYSTPTLYKTAYYHKNKKHGEEITYYDDGSIYEKKPYHEGLLHGKHIRYNWKKLIFEMPYEHGVLHGRSKVYNDVERLYCFLTYEHGELVKEEYPGWIFPPQNVKKLKKES